MELHRITVGHGPRVAWILHGILGSGRNWRTFARSLVEAHPEWTVVLPDLRNHGRTGSAPSPNDLAACAADLASLPEPDWVLGHSFGGKVALQWATGQHGGQQVWVLDSIPFAEDPDQGDRDVMNVLGALFDVPTPVPDRSDLRSALLDHGLSTMLVNWLLTSARKDPDGWRWMYDLPAIREMMASYFRTDFVAAFDDWEGTEVHIVQAERSDRWRPEWIDILERHPKAQLHLLPDAGHWLHVDNPSGLLELLDTYGPV